MLSGTLLLGVPATCLGTEGPLCFVLFSFIVFAGVCATASPAYAQYPYPPYGWPYRYDDSGSARIQVTPKQAEVYVERVLRRDG